MVDEAIKTLALEKALKVKRDEERYLNVLNCIPIYFDCDDKELNELREVYRKSRDGLIVFCREHGLDFWSLRAHARGERGETVKSLEGSFTVEPDFR
ncbi:MAG: hypothetical protein WAZ18_07050 [Alphaproteobacteria bacterium]